MDREDHIQHLLAQRPPPRPVRRKGRWRTLFHFLFLLLCLLLSTMVQPAVAMPLHDHQLWDNWDPAQVGSEWFPYDFISPSPLPMQVRGLNHGTTGATEGSTLVKQAHSAPVGIDGFDIFADIVFTWCHVRSWTPTDCVTTCIPRQLVARTITKGVLVQP